MIGCLNGVIEAKPQPKILDVADTVAANPILTQMSQVIQSSDLVTFLSSKGPFTLFVPTDAAFAKLPPGMLDTLLRPENQVRLQKILLFHVVNGKRLSAKDLLTTSSLLSCEGSPLPLKQAKGAQYVLKAKIVHADIKCENGVIHEIDTVLMPPEASLPPIAPRPPPAPPVVNSPTVTPVNGTNATSALPADTNSSVISVAPIAAPEVAPH